MQVQGLAALVDAATDSNDDEGSLKFPPGFTWGTATAAYQIEGAHDVGGKGVSIWDHFCTQEGKIAEGHHGNIACDHYNRFEEDVKLMHSLGLKNYRFSIAWPRIQPTGKGPANADGIAFYNKLIDCLIAHGIQPFVTLNHWDISHDLQTEFGGWLSKKIVPAFADYASICFEAFGDRVKNWITLNEPWCITVLGYGTSEHAPGIKCEDGSKVYMAGHNCLLAHAAAVDVYRRKYQSHQHGSIGITLNGNWNEPAPDADAIVYANNVAAAERSLLWAIGWFADPIYKGDYPTEMKQRCGDRLPSFTDEEKALLLGSSDFLGINHYMTDMIRDGSHGDFISHWGTASSGGYFADPCTTAHMDPAWPKTHMHWSVVAWGFKELLLWCHNRYKPTGGIIVTENGCAVDEPTEESAVNDVFRVGFLTGYTAAMHEAIAEGADVRGYFAWSFLDNFEWHSGYSKRFGIVRVDYDTLKRTPKASAKWLSRVTAANAVSIGRDAVLDFMHAVRPSLPATASDTCT